MEVEVDSKENRSSSEQEEVEVVDNDPQLQEKNHSNQQEDIQSKNDTEAEEHSKTSLRSEAEIKTENHKEENSAMIATSTPSNVFSPVFVEKPELTRTAPFDALNGAIPKSPKAKTLGERLLENIEFSIDGGPLCQEFVNGSLAERFQENPSDDLQFQYFRQVWEISL